jgi:hypothetical protein
MGVEHRQRLRPRGQPLEQVQQQAVLEQVGEVSGMEMVAVVQGCPPRPEPAPRLDRSPDEAQSEVEALWR